MLVTFRSKADASVMMFEDNAKDILKLLGKDTKEGIINVEEMDNFIAILEAEIARTKIIDAENRAEQERIAREEEEQREREAEEAKWAIKEDDEEEEDDDPFKEKPAPPPKPEPVVTFSARAYPFLQLLKAARKKEKPIYWEDERGRESVFPIPFF